MIEGGQNLYYLGIQYMLDKNFKKDLEIFEEKLRGKENFAFVRFSDGEADILLNKKLVIADDYVIEGNFKHNFGYSKEDHKNFDPDQHGFVREKLVKSFLFSKENYYTGIACPCCIGGIEAHIWMKRNINRSSEFLTWANLFVNGNYSDFIEKIVPVFRDRKIVMVCSKNADVEKAEKELGLEIVKDFRVGENCIVNDHHLIDELKEWIKQEKIEDHVFLFSASSLSEILIHELFKDYENNTYLDIGTTIHPHFGLGLERDYLKGYWKNEPRPDIGKECVWAIDERLVYNESIWWEDIRNLRNDPSVKKGFINQGHITQEQHTAFMNKYSHNFYITLCDNEFAGYIGVIEGDIRVAVCPAFQGNGIAKRMVNSLMEGHPDCVAKVKLDNEASIRLFESCGFKKKYYILEK